MSNVVVTLVGGDEVTVPGDNWTVGTAGVLYVYVGESAKATFAAGQWVSVREESKP